MNKTVVRKNGREYARARKRCRQRRHRLLSFISILSGVTVIAALALAFTESTLGQRILTAVGSALFDDRSREDSRAQSRAWEMGVTVIAALALAFTESTLGQRILTAVGSALFDDRSREDSRAQSRAWEIIEDEEVIGALKEMAAVDARYETLLENSGDYPSDLLELAVKNSEAVDFVLGYTEIKDNPPAVSAKEVPSVMKEDDMQYMACAVPFLQWDERWGYAWYGDSFLAVSGCGPTALAMAAAGLTKDSTITPYTVARYAQEAGYYVNGAGSSWALISDCGPTALAMAAAGLTKDSTITPYTVARYAQEAGYYVNGAGSSWALISEGSSHFGLKAAELSLSENSVLGALSNGHPIICSMRPGDFTTTGHFIVICGVKDGQLKIYDPNGSSHFGLKAAELSLSENSVLGGLSNGHPIICSMRPGDFTTTGHFIVICGVKDGQLKIYDPNSRVRSEKLWDYARIESQINNLWEMSLG